jgi:hypothetical protein
MKAAFVLVLLGGCTNCSEKPKPAEAPAEPIVVRETLNDGGIALKIQDFTEKNTLNPWDANAP